MNKQINHIDNLFREGLSGYTETPPPSVWDALEERLDDKDKKKAGFFYRRRWILLLLAFVSVFSSLMAWRIAGGLGSFAGTRELPTQESTPLQSTISNTAIGAVNSTPVDGNTAMNETADNHVAADNEKNGDAIAPASLSDNSKPNYKPTADAKESGNVSGKTAMNAAPKHENEQTKKTSASQDGAFAMADIAEPSGTINEEKPAPKLEVIRYIVKKSMSNNIQIAEAEPVLGIAEHHEPELLSEPGADDDETAATNATPVRTSVSHSTKTMTSSKRTAMRALAQRRVNSRPGAGNTTVGGSAFAGKATASVRRRTASKPTTGSIFANKNATANSPIADGTRSNQLAAKATPTANKAPIKSGENDKTQATANNQLKPTSTVKPALRANNNAVASTSSASTGLQNSTSNKTGGTNATAKVTAPLTNHDASTITTAQAVASASQTTARHAKTNHHLASGSSSRQKKADANEGSPNKLAAVSRTNAQQQKPRSTARMRHPLAESSKSLVGSGKAVALATTPKKIAPDATKQTNKNESVANTEQVSRHEKHTARRATTSPLKLAANTQARVIAPKTSTHVAKKSTKTESSTGNGTRQSVVTALAEKEQNNRKQAMKSFAGSDIGGNQPILGTAKKPETKYKPAKQLINSSAMAVSDQNEEELAIIPTRAPTTHKNMAVGKKQQNQVIASASQRTQQPSQPLKHSTKKKAAVPAAIASHDENNTQATKTPLAAAPAKITLRIPGTFKEDTMPFTMKPKAADTTAHAIAAAAKIDSPQAIKNGHRGYEIGIKGGYEGGFTNDAARKMVISPYFEKQLSDKWSFLTQPAIKISTLAGRALSGSQSFYKDVDSSVSNTGTYNLTLSIGAGGSTVIDTVVRTNYLYSKTVDYLSKTYSIGGRYIELEIPLLMKYKITDKLSVYGGFTLNYSRTIRIKELTDNNGEVILNKLLPTYSHPGVAVSPQAISAVLQPAGNPLSSYSGPLYPNSKNGLFRMGFMFGASYEFKKRYMFDVLMQQGSVKANMEGGYNINNALSATYFRFTLGYRLFKK